MAEKKRGPGRPPGSKNKKQNKKSTAAPQKTKQERIQDMQNQRDADKKVLDVIWGVIIVALGVFFFFTIYIDDTGTFGATVHDICKGLMGQMSYVLPFFFILSGVLLFTQKVQHINLRTVICSVLMYVNFCILNSYRFINEKALAFGLKDIAGFYKQGVKGKGGGAIGMEIGELLVKFFGKPGLLIIAIAAVLICVLLVFNTPISKAITNYSNKREEKRLLKELEEVEKERLLAEKKTALIESRASQSSANDDLQNTTEIMSSPLNGISKFFKSPDAVEKDSKAIIELSRDEGPIGTEAASQTEFGKGLADINENKHAEKSYGLEGNTSTKAGFGLDGYESMFGLGGESLPESKGLDMTAPMTPASVALAAAAAHVFDDEAEDNTKAPKASKPSSRSKTKVAEEVNTDEIANELVSGFCNGEADPSYKLPSIELLKKGRGSKQMMTNYELEQKAVLLQKTLRDFKVESTILNVTQGSSVTRYEVQPATGVKVSKITELANDIALNLRAKSVRIEAPIPGKAAVGIEVENEKPTPVLIRDLIESDEFQSSASKITFVVGKDISGNNIVADLKTMPHLLIAGATGSGKSVCINSIIASLLYKAKPSEVKLIMIDPKVVELGNYNGIPHLLTSVVTDPRKAARALAEAVAEMNKRYEEFAKMGVKDLESYNELMIANQEPQNVKPQVVIIIDELADLMMAAKSQVEESIARLAQKARAAGMHLIIATQRPSVDVVTGLIKANVPSRIAFSVASQIDSRTILDMGGAESLLGRGDMLFSPIGSSKPYRVQGPYISDSEIAKLINYVKGQGKAQYDENLSNAIEGKSETKAEGSQDELTEDAVEFILKSKQASTSMLQRRFRIGYNRAARIIDEIEEMGIIGPPDGSRGRQVLITEDEYYGNFDEASDVDYEVTVDDEGVPEEISSVNEIIG